MNNIKTNLSDLLAIDESLDDVYAWKTDDIKLPFYVYQQYTFDVGSITYAVRFMRSALALGIKARHISYVVVGKKLNKKVSNKIVGIGNVRKFIATVYAIIKHHLETAPKANRGVAIRFDADFFDRMQKILGLILRLKLKQEYKFSEDFTWSPIEGSKNFYVWKKQFTFKTIYKEFLVAQEKGVEDNLVTNDLDVDPNPEEDKAEILQSVDSLPTSKPKITKTVYSFNKVIDKASKEQTNSKNNHPLSYYKEKIKCAPRFFLNKEYISFFFIINEETETGSILRFNQNELTSSVVFTDVSLDKLYQEYTAVESFGYDLQIFHNSNRTYVSTSENHSKKSPYNAMFYTQVIGSERYIGVNLHQGTLEVGLKSSDIKHLIDFHINNQIINRKKLSGDEFFYFPIMRRVASFDIINSKYILVLKDLGNYKFQAQYLTNNSLVGDFLENETKEYSFIGFNEKTSNNFVWNIIKAAGIEEYKGGAESQTPPKEIEVLPLDKLSNRVIYESLEFTKRKDVEKKISIGPFDFTLNSDLATIAEKLEKIAQYKEVIEKENPSVFGSSLENFYEQVANNLESMFRLDSNEIRKFNEDCIRINSEGFSSSSETAIKNYTGTSYEHINKVLRGDKPYNDLMDYTKETLRDLDNAFKVDAVRVADMKDVSVFRGQTVSEKEVNEIIKTRKYKTNGFLSTTMSISTAYAFLKYDSYLHPKEYADSSTKEGRMANMMAITGLHRIPAIYPGFKSQHNSETEIILPRGTVFNLINHHTVISKNNKKLFVTTYDIIGVGEVVSIIESRARGLLEMVEDKKMSNEMAKNVLVIDSLVDLLDEGDPRKNKFMEKAREGYTDQEWEDAVVKWTTD